MNPTSLLTHKELQRILDYNPITGIFYWKISNAKCIQIGDIAGTTHDGYVSIKINSIPYLAHRLAWFYYYGYWPENLIDHKDQIKWHNWILNLREVSYSCNIRNRGNLKNNTSGVKGVHWSKPHNKWYSQISINNKPVYLGLFKDFNEAVCHRLAAEQCLNWSNCETNSPAYLYVKENVL